MTIHSGDDISRQGPKDLGHDLGPHGEWPRPQTLPRHKANVTLRNKKRAVTANPDDDTFECNTCHRVLYIDESIRLGGRHDPLICTQCAASDSTNMSMLEHGMIQPEDL
jgi:hypothetical protein